MQQEQTIKGKFLKVSESFVTETLRMSDMLETIVTNSGKDAMISPEECMQYLNSIRGIMPTILHRLAVVSHYIDTNLRTYIFENPDQYKLIKNSSTITVKIANGLDEDLSKCYHRLEAAKRTAEMASQHLTTMLSYYKVERQTTLM